MVAGGIERCSNDHHRARLCPIRRPCERYSRSLASAWHLHGALGCHDRATAQGHVLSTVMNGIAKGETYALFDDRYSSLVEALA